MEVDAVSRKKIGKKAIRLIKGERFGLLKMMDKRFIAMIVDHDLNVKREGSFLIQIKNPERRGGAGGD